MDIRDVEGPPLSGLPRFNKQDVDALKHLKDPAHGGPLRRAAFLIRDGLVLLLQFQPEIMFSQGVD